MALKTLAPGELKDLIEGPGEIAVLDIRETGLFTTGHLFHASSLPLFRAGTLLPALIPRRSAPVVLVDLDGSSLKEAAGELQRLGLRDVSVLEGGVNAWREAGYPVFGDLDVPSKAFGESVERTLGTPTINALELERRLAAGDDLIVVDGRTREEFYNFSVPSAHNIPNAELPYRIHRLLEGPSTTVVVNCAGRTRSIIGAQGLINSGLRNPVLSLEDGTQGWLLAGLALERGPGGTKIARSVLKSPDPAALPAVRTALASLLSKLHVRTAGDDELAAFRADGARTTYLIDPRALQDHESGRPRGFRHVPGGQLVQTTGRRLAVLRSRIVILDTDGVRGPWTASWLAQAGAGEIWLYRPAAATPLMVGPPTSEIVLDPEAGERNLISPIEAAELFAKGARIYDVEDSVAFHRRRISGAVFAAPDLLAGFVRGDPHAGPAILTSSDGVLASILAARLAKESLKALSVAGGTSAWIEAGLPVEVGQPGVDLTNGRDTRYGGWESYLGVVEESAAARDERFRKYLAWERDLVNRIDVPGATARFSLIAP